MCNPKKSGASLVCIIFPQITPKILTKHISLAGTDHWNYKLSTNNQCERKSTWKSTKDYISDIFWVFKSTLHIIHAATYIALFLQYHQSIFVSTIFSFCVFIFNFFSLLFLLRDTTRNILQFTVFVSISLKSAHKITEIKNTL